MVIEVDSLLRPANSTTYKNRKRNRRESSPVPSKRVKMFRDMNDAYVYRPASLHGKRGPERNYQGSNASALSPHSQMPSTIPLFQGSSNHMAATRTAAAPQFVRSDNTPLLPAASITSVKENAEVLSPPSETLIHPSATPSPFHLAKPFPLSSPFKGGRSRNNNKCMPINNLPTTRQARTKSTQNLPNARQNSFKQSRIPTIQSAGIHSSKPKHRTASSTLTRTTERSRAASWLVPPPPTRVPRSLAQVTACAPVDQRHNNDCRSHVSQREEDESSPQSFGMTSFFADTPDAFSTPVRATRQKGGANRMALTKVFDINGADQSFSSASTPNAGSQADPMRSISLPPLSPSSLSTTIVAKSQPRHVESHPNLIAPPRQRAQRTADRLQMASSSLESSPMPHTPAACSSLPYLARALPAAIFPGPPAEYAMPQLTFPVSPSRNGVLLTPTSSPLTIGNRPTDLHKHHTLNDTATPHKHILNNLQHPASAGATIGSQRHQFDLEGDMLSLTISDGLTISDTRGETCVKRHPLSEIDQRTNGLHEAINSGRKKIKRTISQTDDEETTKDDLNVLRGSVDSCVRSCPSNRTMDQNNERTSGPNRQPGGLHSRRKRMNIDEALGKKSSRGGRCKALSTKVFLPAPLTVGGHDVYRGVAMTQHVNNGVDDGSDDELLLKHGQTKRFVTTLHFIQLFS